MMFKIRINILDLHSIYNSKTRNRHCRIDCKFITVFMKRIFFKKMVLVDTNFSNWGQHGSFQNMLPPLLDYEPAKIHAFNNMLSNGN